MENEIKDYQGKVIEKKEVAIGVYRIGIELPAGHGRTEPRTARAPPLT